MQYVQQRKTYAKTHSKDLADSSDDDASGGCWVPVATAETEDGMDLETGRERGGSGGGK